MKIKGKQRSILLTMPNNANDSTKEKRKYTRLNSERKQLVVAYLKGHFDAKGKVNKTSFTQCANLFNISSCLAMRIWKTTNNSDNESWDFNSLNFKIIRKKKKDLKVFYREKLELADNKECKTFRQLSEVIGVSKSTCYNLFKLGLLVRIDSDLLVPNWEVFNSDRINENILGQLGRGSTGQKIQLDSQSNNGQIIGDSSNNVAENNVADSNQSLILPSTLQTTTNNQSELKIDGTIEDEFSD